MKRTKLALYVFGALLLVSGAVIASSGTHWGYEGHEGPGNWATLSPDYETCGIGAEQSPVDIAGFDSSSLTPMETSFTATGGKVINNGHTLQATMDSGSFSTIDGERYDLLQFHFHTPSEHTIADRHIPMEIHFVHKNSEGGLAVIGVMVEEGAMNSAIEPIIEALPSQVGSENELHEAFNPGSLLPTDMSVYRYMGSLTTPPCSEKVKWHVAKSPIEMSKEQIEAFEHIMGENFRPVQRHLDAKGGISKASAMGDDMGTDMDGEMMNSGRTSTTTIVIALLVLVILAGAAYSLTKKK